MGVLVRAWVGAGRTTAVPVPAESATAMAVWVNVGVCGVLGLAAPDAGLAGARPGTAGAGSSGMVSRKALRSAGIVHVDALVSLFT